MGFMGCSAIKAIGIHNVTARAAVKVLDEVIDTLEHWCRWDISIARETVEGVHYIRVGILHNI